MDSDTPVGRRRLDDQLCFALYAATNAVIRTYRPMLTELGLTYPQYLVLMSLWESDDVPTTEIADRLMLPVHGVSPILHRLQEAGFVERVRDTDDRRVVRVRLTPAGADLEQAVVPVQDHLACATGLTNTAIDELRDRLHELSGNLAEAADAADGASSSPIPAS